MALEFYLYKGLRIKTLKAITVLVIAPAACGVISAIGVWVVSLELRTLSLALLAFTVGAVTGFSIFAH